MRNEERDDDRLVAHVRHASQNRVMDAEAGGYEVELVLKRRERGGEQPRDSEPRDERQQRPQPEPPVAADHADGARRDRQKVRADRHRATSSSGLRSMTP
jgi:hypothetical protein